MGYWSIVLGVAVLVLALAAPSLAAGEPLTLSLTPDGGVYGMFTRPLPADAKTPAEPVNLKVSVKNIDTQARKVQIAFSAVDVFGKPVAAQLLPAAITLDILPNATEARTVPFTAGTGYFEITATATSADVTVAKVATIGVIPPAHPGLRKDSFFASNTSGLRVKQELQFLQAIGMKVQRAHFQPEVKTTDKEWAKKPATGEPLPLDFTRQDQALAEAIQHDTWVLPIVGYGFQGSGGTAKTDLATRLGMHGPPRDLQEFVATWETILRHYPDITTYEVWNEPWIFGWTWAAPPAEYRKMQKMWCEMALKVNPDYRIIAGNSSMFTLDHIEHDPSCWKGLLQGTTHHPYAGAGFANLRAGLQPRSIDDGLLITRRMGLPYYYLTEGGTEVKPENGIENADKIVQYFVRAALVGTFQGNAQWNIGYGPAWTRSNTAFAVMTNFLEDRPIVADIWPEQELIWGAIFANPKFATAEVKALPRAAELATRWNVPIPEDRAHDTTKVAVIWSLTGESNSKIDTDGTLTIANAKGLQAYDLTGREIPAKNGRLTVPFSIHPVYITSDTLSVVELRKRIGEAAIAQVTPLNLYALSLGQPANQPQTLGVRMENQLNREISGTLTLRIAGQAKATSATYTIPAGKLVEVAVPWPGVTANETNQYAVTLTATSKTGRGQAALAAVTKAQVISAAYFAKRTITIDGTLADWQGLSPVLLDSDMVKQGIDLTQYLLNPHLERPTGTPENKRVVARVYTAYDDQNIYVAAAINEDTLACSAGNPIKKGRGQEQVELPYKNAMPDGLNHIVFAGDVFMFAFGFRDRVPGWGRQMNDPYAWKGHFYDTDYQYTAHISTEGDQLLRQWGIDATRRNAYQTEAVPGVGPVPGAQVKITRDEANKLTIYETALPRASMPLFDPAKGRCRFGFVLKNNEGLGTFGLEWSEVAGVFDHWLACGSYAPSWTATLPCQTYFGITK